MYQGKFDAKKKNADVSVSELVAQRKAASQKTPNAAASGRRTPARRETNVDKTPAKKKRRGPRRGTVIFYTLFFMFVLVFYTSLYFVMGALRDWLVAYESAQPTLKCQQVFEEYFADPDWGKLYDAAAISDTVYEGKDAFAAYMEEKVGDTELTYVETSAGLSGDMKYVVRLDDENLATFTLVNQNTAEKETDIPDWQLGAIQFNFQREGSYDIRIPEGWTAAVNGIPLDDSNVVRIATPKAAEYLPEGMECGRTCTLQVNGLIAQPTVTVTDESGSQAALSYDEEARTFFAEIAEETITEEERELALKALKTHSTYAISRSVTDADLAKYFKRGTTTFTSVTSMDRRWIQAPRSYDFLDETVTDMCRYSDSLYSVRVCFTMTQTRGDGSVKENTIEQSMFFEKQTSGKWLCIEMTAVDVSQPTEQVRLIFMNEDTVLEDQFYAADTDMLTCPQVSAPEGKALTGWMMEQKDERGNSVMHLVFQTDENGVANLPTGTILEPMTLYPLFEKTE